MGTLASPAPGSREPVRGLLMGSSTACPMRCTGEVQDKSGRAGLTLGELHEISVM